MMKLMKLIAVAAVASFVGVATVQAATPTTTVAIDGLTKNQNGDYEVMIGGKSETFSTERFCTGSTSVEFSSDRHDGFTFTVTLDGDQLRIGSFAVDFRCPPSFDAVAMRAALVADLSSREYLQKAHVSALLQAFDAGDYQVVTASVAYPGNRITVDNETYATLESPYAPRLSEGNFYLGHLRDEFPVGTQILIVQADGLRFSILWTSCNDAIEIEKLAIGQKVTVRTQVRVEQPEQRVVTPGGRWVYSRFELDLRPNNHRWSKAVWARLGSTEVVHTAWGYSFFGPNERGWCQGGNNRSHNGSAPSGNRDRYCWGERRTWVTN